MAQISKPLKAELTFDPPGPKFLIDRTASMPTIRATVSVAGLDLRTERAASYTWTVTLTMQNSRVPLSGGRRISHPPMMRITTQPTLILPFAKVRGGQLTVSVTIHGLVSAAGQAVERTPALAATRADLEIQGTNPTEASLIASGASDLMIKIIRHESTTRQFAEFGSASGYPLFSQDRLGGVGLTQLTVPRPSDDQIWDWKANLRAGMEVLAQKRQIARSYLTGYVRSAEFQGLVKAYNAERARAAAVPRPGSSPKPVVPPADVVVTLPAPTDDQIEREALRAYNGYGAGVRVPNSAAHSYLHEYVALTDANAILVVHLNADGRTGTALWHENTATDREDFWRKNGLVRKSPSGNYLYPGDPNYVANVLGVTISDPVVTAPAQPGVPSPVQRRL